MEFKINRDVILNGLQFTQSIVDKKSTMPILSNALFNLADDKLKISATDLEVGVIVEIPAHIISPGRSVMPAKSIYEIARELKGDEITFKSKDNGWMELSSGKSNFKIVQLAAEEFPSMPSVDETKLLSINPDDLTYLIEKTIFAVSTDEAKYNLGGIYVEKANDKNLRFVATDGHRLALVERTGQINIDKGVIIPRKGINEIKKMLSVAKEFFIGVDGRNIVLKSELATLIIRLIDGDFPDYKKVLPKKQEKIIIVEKEAFVGALRRVSLLNQDKNRGVRMIFSSGNMEIQSSNPDLGEAREELEITYKGERFEVGFNPRYFIDNMAVLQDEKIIVELNDEISPCVIRSEYDKSLINVIMPMRL